MATLERAIALAALAHEGQKDKTGEPYILHPLRMMMRLNRLEAKIVAALHDVVEDTEWTMEGLATEGFSSEILDALDRVTKREGEDYMDFVQRAAGDAIAREVKLADLEDNMNILRLSEIRDKDLERMRKYHQAWQMLKRHEPEIRP
jgi:(p)ppGpp synthase/HD superfamily hydrolase